MCGEIASHAYDLFEKNIKPPFKIRSLGVTVSGFDNGKSQITLDEQVGNYGKREAVERCVDVIRKKHGYDKLQRGIVAEEPNEMRKHPSYQARQDRLSRRRIITDNFCLYRT